MAEGFFYGNETMKAIATQKGMITVFPEASTRIVARGSARRLSRLVDHIGGTPMVHLDAIGRGLPPNVCLAAKAEHLNPGGSVKDRAALRMISEGLDSGALSDGRILIDATSGNTGIAYAMLGAALGIPVVLAIPGSASDERKRIVEAFGAEVVITDAMELTDGAQRYVVDRVRENPDAYFYPDQYNNPANWQAHFDGTGAEIIEQTEGSVTHFVAALGTTGTFTGVARRLNSDRDRVVCVAVQPDSPLHAMEGVKHLETAIVPGIFDASLVDETIVIKSEEAFAMTRRLAAEEGLYVGVSSGANVLAALRIAERLDSGTVVTVLCDTGSRYSREPFWTQST